MGAGRCEGGAVLGRWHQRQRLCGDEEGKNGTRAKNEGPSSWLAMVRGGKGYCRRRAENRVGHAFVLGNLCGAAPMRLEGQAAGRNGLAPALVVLYVEGVGVGSVVALSCKS